MLTLKWLLYAKSSADTTVSNFPPSFPSAFFWILSAVPSRSFEFIDEVIASSSSLLQHVNPKWFKSYNNKKRICFSHLYLFNFAGLQKKHQHFFQQHFFCRLQHIFVVKFHQKRKISHFLTVKIIENFCLQSSDKKFSTKFSVLYS